MARVGADWWGPRAAGAAGVVVCGGGLAVGVDVLVAVEEEVGAAASVLVVGGEAVAGVSASASSSPRLLFVAAGTVITSAGSMTTLS